MNSSTTILLVFVAGFLGVIMIWSVTRDVSRSDRRRVKKRLREELGQATAETQMLFKDLNAIGADQFGEEHVLPRGLWPSFALMVEQSGLDITPKTVLLRSLAVSATVGLLALMVTGVVWYALPPAAIGFACPIAYYAYKRRQRLDKFRAQLADAFSLMSRVLRAGQTMTQAMNIVCTELGDPISREFALCQEQQNLGLKTEAALWELARRTGLMEIRMFVVASLVHRQSGGNFADLLDNLSRVVQERFRVRGVVSSLTAEGRLQAGILLVLPLLLYVLLSAMRPGYFDIVLDKYPWLVAVAFVSELLGAVSIRKIINFDF